ncbi:MAG: glucose-1-phosphate thymidylyltransferase RfbA [Flavobacteriaceae bacterium]|nr:glucose-1-phosphate thymidylyltransferase RfbA [Flavobacteriaceae bacterium]
MKGIILAGGSGTRLFPITKGTSKQLLNVYDKPMIYYPLSVLLHAGIKEILIISTPVDLPSFKRLFGNGKRLGISICYKEQPSPGGLAQAFIIGEDFIGEDDVCLVLGDNIFHGIGFIEMLKNAKQNVINNKVATIFGYHVNEPKRYGIVEFDKNNKVLSIEEKPSFPKSNFAVVGLYFYPNTVIKIAKGLEPSERGELEITSINQEYLINNNLDVKLLGRGFTWLDTGTHDSLLEASNLIHALEKRQGLKVACIEEIVFDKGYITFEKLREIAQLMSKNNYGKYLLSKNKK